MNEFFVLGSFVAVVMAGLLYAAFSAIFYQPSAPSSGTPTPPPFQMSIEEYRAETKDILSPFLGQVGGVDAEAAADASALLADLAGRTQERLMRMRVPGEAKDVHLTLVLLLDAWKKASSGVMADVRDALARTDEVLAVYPWLK